MRGFGPAGLRKINSRRGLIGPVLAGVLIGFYVLLPLDRGFPTIPIFGRPISSAIVATLIVFFVVSVQSRGTALSYFLEPYSIVQSGYFCILMASAVRSASPPSALHWCLLYYCTFVLNYVILRYITGRYGIHRLSALVVAVGVAAAAIGIVQARFGTRLPLYDGWFADYFGVAAEDYALASARAAGTMNNPILYSMAMVLVIPYTLDLKNKFVRVLALSAVLIAAGMSGSRTALLVIPVFVVGAVAVYHWRALWALPTTCLGLFLLVQSLGGLSKAEFDPRVSYLLERVGFRQESAAALDADRSITYRQEALAEGIREMSHEWGGLTWIVGRGYNTARSVGESVSAGYNTVDNVFLGVVYEQGLLGLVVFVSAFVGFLIRTKRASTVTLHWYAPIGLALAGVSFNWDAYSTFNILVVGSMAVASWHVERSSATEKVRARRASSQVTQSGWVTAR